MSDAEKRALLSRVMVASALGTAFIAVGFAASSPSPYWKAPLLFTALHLACWRALRVVPLVRAGVAYFGGTIALHLVSGLLAGGFTTQLFPGFVIEVGAATLVFGRRGGALTALAALMCMATLMAVEAAGLLPARAPVPEAWKALTLAVAVALAFVITSMVHAAIASATARGELQAQELRVAASRLETEVKLRRVAQEQLSESYERAVRGERVKSTFLATMSHELRTPMNAVLGLTDLLLVDASDGAQREALRTIHESSRDLLALLDDVLDFSKIEAGAMRLDATPFSPADVAEAVRRLFAERAQARGLDLTVHVGDEVPRRLVGDPLRLKQVLTNLLSNAIKFTSTGSVRLAVTWSGHGAEGTLSCAVTDTGMGVSAAQREQLFQPFQQGDASMTRRFGGTGLGLAIVKRLCELQGGTVRVDSVEGTGSTFTATARYAVDAGPARRKVQSDVKAVASLGPHVRVLVAEDNPINQLVARRLLERLAVTTVVVGDGEEALRALQAQPFDVVLMDLQMPRLDGLEATRRARELDGAQPWIIALTANALREHEEAALQAGVDAFLAKPVTLDQLSEALERGLRRTAALR